MVESKGGTPEGTAEERILILAPEGRNAMVATAALGRHGFHCDICEDSRALAKAIGEGAGAVLLTDHFLHAGDLGPVAQALRGQPVWSDLPLVLLAWPETGELALEAMMEASRNVRLIERPASVPALVSGVESALRARRRQYEIRSLLAELRNLNENLETRVAQRTQKVRELAVALAEAEEQERERIAQILHDHLQQILVAVTIQLQLVASTLGPDKPVRTSLAEIEEMVDEAVDVTRTLSIELSPPMLREGGLEPALSWLQNEMKSKHDLDVSLTTGEVPSTVGEELEALLFRTARELLFNVVKHSGTRRARVTLGSKDGRLVLTVADDGRGFSPKGAVTSGSGYGLPRIRERVNLHGGTFEIESAPGEGASVTLTIPV